MKKIYLSIFFVFVLISGFAQWSQVNIGTTEDLYSIDYYSTNDIWIGSFNQFIKTTNAGTNWNTTNPLKDGTNASILPANMYDLALTSNTSAIATGLWFMGNNECILTTTNSGANWNYATNNNSVPLLRYLKSVDLIGTKAVAVGNNGRIAISNNSGTSWTFVNSGVTNMINDVKFISQDTIVAVGTNIVLHSFDGGTTWTSTFVSGDFISVSAYHNIVYAAQSSTSLLKSTDFGASYSIVNLPFSANGVINSLNRDTLVLAGTTDVYISKNGALYWEKYDLSGYQPIKMFDFLNNQNAYAVGNAGYVIKTSSFNTIPSFPITSFAVQGGNTSICINDSITLNNTTAPLAGYIYNWKLNGVNFSSTYNTGIRLSTAGTYTLSLTTTNSSGSSTQNTIITVTGHDLGTLDVISSSDSTCSGNLAALYVRNTDNGATYFLRNGITQIGSFQTGNGSQLNFTYPTPITSSLTLNIKATKTNSCFTDSAIVYKTINLYNNTSTPTISCVPTYTFCNILGQISGITNVSFGSINNTTDSLVNNYFDYSCCFNTNVVMGNTYPISIKTSYPFGEYVKVWIDYNNDGAFNQTDEMVLYGFANHVLNGNIYIDTTRFFNQKLRMRIGSSHNSFGLTDACSDFGCGQIEDYSITISPSPTLPTASFTSTSTSGCNTSVNLTNTGVNAVSYTWDFGDGSSTVTTFNATHTYSTNGTYTISLTNCNPTGCTTTTQTINVVIAQTPVAMITPINIQSYSTNYFGYISFDTLLVGGYGMTPYKDFTCTNQIGLRAESSYNISVQSTNNYSSGCERFGIWIDFNNDGVLNNTGGEMLNAPAGMYNCCANGQTNFSALIPASAVRNTPLRMRMLIYSGSYHGTIYDASNNGNIIRGGEARDYTVFINDPAPPVADFTSNYTTQCSGFNIQFSSLSQNATSYIWDFGDGTIESETLNYRFHSYANAGVYNVKLIAINSLTSDTLIKSSYITINQSLPTPDINFNAGVLSTTAIATSYKWYKNNVIISGATGTSYTPTSDGAYQVSAVNTNGCGSLSANYLHYPVHPNFTMNPTTQCANSSITFNYSTTNANYYTIDWGDGTTGGPYTTNLQYHTYTTAGVYTVKMIACKNTGECDSLIRTNYITILPIQTPVITRNGTILSSSISGISYQWFKSPSTIPLSMSNTQHFNAGTQYGEYTVQVSGGGCFALSAPYQYYPLIVGFTADSTSYCGVNSADVTFTNTSSNAVNYTWDFGDGTTSTLSNPSHLYTAPGNYTIKLIGCNASGICDSLILIDMIKIDAIPFTSTITPNGNLNPCSSDSIVLNASNNPLHTYQWKENGQNLIGETTSTYYVQNNGTYSLFETNSIGCTALSSSVIVTFDNSCVWPGDADYSSQVDNYDLMPIGMYYGATGPARNTISNVWQANHASDFGTLSSNGYDIKQVDCNGDGIINMGDTLAINTNFNLSHNRNGLPQHDTVNNFYPSVSFSSSSSTYQAGDWINVDVMMGTVSNQAINIYGMIFNLYTDNSLIEPGTISISYPNSWLMSNGVDGISIGKVDESINLTYAGLTRTDHTNKTGYGKIATLRFKASNAITNTSSLYIDYDDLYPYDNTGNYIGFTTNSINLTILPNSVGINTLDNNLENNFNIIGNPLTNESKVELNLSTKSNVKIEILNALGQSQSILIDTEIQAGKHEFSLKNSFTESKKGIYFVKYTCNGVIKTKRVLKID